MIGGFHYFLFRHRVLHRLHLHFIRQHFRELRHLQGLFLQDLHKALLRLVPLRFLLLLLFLLFRFPPTYACGKRPTSFKCLTCGSSIIMYTIYINEPFYSVGVFGRVFGELGLGCDLGLGLGCDAYCCCCCVGDPRVVSTHETTS